MASPRTRKSALFRLLDQTAIPVYVVSSEGQIIYCNEALCNWTGQTSEALEQITCKFSNNAESTLMDRVASGLCPDPHSFLGSASQGHVFAEKDGKPEYRQASFQPLAMESSADGCPVLVIVNGDPIPSVARQDTESFLNLHQAVCEMQYESRHRINLDLVVGTSLASKKIRFQIDAAIDSNCDLVIAGPTGSGRMQIAELIHYAKGPHIAGPLIPIEGRLCDAEMVQSTIKDLYRQSKEYPDEPLGRLLLKDIDHMPESAQAELLGFFEMPDFRLPIVATATHWPVNEVEETPIGDSTLQQILTYISTMVIQVPSLSDRKEDIPFLVQAVVEETNSHSTNQLAGVTDAAMDLLRSYHWPGEMSELIETVRTAANDSKAVKIDISDLPKHLALAVRSQQSTVHALEPIDLDEFLSEVELELIQRAVKTAEGNRSKAAKLLQISRARLLRRLKEIGHEESEAADST